MPSAAGLLLAASALLSLAAFAICQTSCPSRCLCFRTTVRCMYLRLESLPLPPPNTTVLRLDTEPRASSRLCSCHFVDGKKENGPTIFPWNEKSSFHFKSPEKRDLRFNRIKNINSEVFRDLKHLTTLLLSDNMIQSLDDGAFQGLEELRHLYLYKNKIRRLEGGAFDGLPNLEQLYLHYNKIEQLPPNLFTNLTNLERLFLHENKIQYIPKGEFTGLKKLKRVRLDGNSLVCDCGLKDMMTAVPEADVAAVCQYPENMKGKTLHEMSPTDIVCKEPRIIEGPHDVEISFGGSAVFTCRVDSSDSEAEIVWMLNSNEIDTRDPRYSIKDDGTLVVSSMTDKDMGIYECMVKSPYGVSKSQGAKTLMGNHFSARAEWKRKPKDQVAKEGDTVQLECSVSGGEVTWLKDGQPISAPVSAEGTLTLPSVTPDDTASYACRVDTPQGHLQAEARLTVSAHPRLIQHPESQHVKNGETVKMHCRASGTPPPTLSWFKNGASLQPSERISFNEDFTEVTISNVVTTDSGLYTCMAQSVEGAAEGSGELRVKAVGPRPPAFLVTPYPILAQVGTSVELPCKAQGEPHPAIEWLKNGEPVQLDRLHRVFPVGSLRLYNISTSDAGVYRCTASNEYGEISVHATLSVEGAETNEAVILTALEDAKKKVDKAVNSTIENLFTKKGSKSPSALMRLFRYPDEQARSVVRAADVYENTLLNIRKHIASGLHFNETEDFNYEEVLSPDQLQLIARMSGCNEHQRANCSDMCFHTKYRTIDGTCNNLQHTYWGASHTAFRRILRPVYENGFSQPVGWDKNRKYNGFKLPNARTVSLSLIRTENITQDDEITHMVMQWGQFLDHDLDHAIPSTTAESWEGVDCKKTCKATPPCFPMEVDHDDPRIKNRRCMDFIRSSAICSSGETSIFFNKIHPREQINQLTAFIDGSQVYGFHDNRSILLRDYTHDLGLLRVGLQTESGKSLLPVAGLQEVDCRRDPTENEAGCFLAGDIRVNEQISLVAMHTIWLREHNRIATELKEINPHWTGDIIFHEARKIVGAEMQHITYQHWLKNVLGEKGMELLGGYKEYNPNVNPGISNAFATAAFRFGHTLINPVLARLDSEFKTIPQGDLPLGRAFFAPWRIIEEGGTDALMRGMFMSPAKKKMPTQNLNNELTDHLFTSFHAVALDLASMNVQRSRDHGIPFYNEFRKFCNLSSADTFDDLKSTISNDEVRQTLERLYGHPHNIDIFVGGILEDQFEGAKFGPTFRCLITEQFRRIRDGDRFWYENPSTFKPAQLTQIRQSSLARVLCDNGDNITRISPNVFILPSKRTPSLVNCDEIPKMDLRFWYECEDCGSDSSTRGRRGIKDEDMEERMEGLESLVQELQKTVKSLKKRMRGLTAKCRDNRGVVRRDGDTWQKDTCTLCECQGTQVSCTKIQCAKLTCDRQEKVEGRCCPVCV